MTIPQVPASGMVCPICGTPVAEVDHVPGQPDLLLLRPCRHRVRATEHPELAALWRQAGTEPDL